jgi:uncharacterized protein YjiK
MRIVYVIVPKDLTDPEALEFIDDGLYNHIEEAQDDLKEFETPSDWVIRKLVIAFIEEE